MRLCLRGFQGHVSKLPKKGGATEHSFTITFAEASHGLDQSTAFIYWGCSFFPHPQKSSVENRIDKWNGTVDASEILN